VRELGRGGFGVVLEAIDPTLKRHVAIKLVRPGTAVARTGAPGVEEAEAVARLSHPNVVQLHEAGNSDFGPFLVFELLHGESLSKRLERGPMTVNEAGHLALEVARGLASAHAHAVVHRDLSPSNVFLTDDGQVKVLDFGLSLVLGRRRTIEGGTPGWMAPEQRIGNPEDERTDVWALGAILFRALAGTEPARATLEVPQAPELVALIDRMLSPEPVKRPRDGGEVVKELAPIVEALRTPQPPITVRVGRRRKPRSLTVATFGVILLLGVAGATYTFTCGSGDGTRGVVPVAGDDRVTVAVADFANETGERELDSISGLFITALEQHAHLRVLTRGRMFDVVRQLGRGDVERLDEPLAREVGRRTDARALLLATIRRLDDTYGVDLRALDPVRDEYLFTLRDRAPGKASVFELVDRLAEGTRQRLVPGVVADRPPAVAAITTQNVAAWERLFRAREAIDRSDFRNAKRLLAEALQADPEFALAHHHLGLVAWLAHDGTRERERDALDHLAAAARRSDRLPEKERLSLLAMQASLEGRWEEERRLRDELAAAFPLDKDALLEAGNVRVVLDEAADAIPYFQRALQLDPDYTRAMQGLAEAIVASGEAARHVEWLQREARAIRHKSLVRLVAIALLQAGREEEALALYRRATEDSRAKGGSGWPWPPPTYALFLVTHGRPEEAEALMREALARAPGYGGLGRVNGDPLGEHEVSTTWNGLWAKVLDSALIAQGRVSEAEAAWGSSGAEDIERKLELVAARGSVEDVRDVRDLAVSAEPPDSDLLLSAAAAMADVGDVAAVARLAARARESPRRDGRPLDRLYPGDEGFADALEAWASGSAGKAEERLRALGAGPYVGYRHEALRFEATLALGRGDCATAVELLERVRAMKRISFHRAWSYAHWTYPRTLHSLAACYERLGDLEKARDRNDELLRLWRRADADLPLLAEARALRGRIEPQH